MVAKINVGSSLFGALSYNQKKMDEGVGRVLCSNKMTENEKRSFNIHTCMRDFGNQMPSDIKTEKPVIHISLNPHPAQQPRDTPQPSHEQGLQGDDSSLGGLFDMPMETHGTDHEEDEFRRRMQRKKKKKLQKH